MIIQAQLKKKKGEMKQKQRKNMKRAAVTWDTLPSGVMHYAVGSLRKKEGENKNF